MKFILSDESINSYGFKVKTSGIQLKDFKKNPVMLYNHDSNEVIGKWEKIKIEDNKLTAVPLFDEDDEFAMKIKRKVEKELIKGNSIGFSILEMDEEDGIPVVSKSELRESSITALPANKQAVKLYYKGNELSLENDIKLSMEEIDKEYINKKEYTDMDLNEIKTILNVENDEDIKVSIEKLNSKLSTLEETVQSNQEMIIEKDEKINELSSVIAEFERIKKEGEVDAFLSTAVKNGKITSEQIEKFKTLSADNFDVVKEIIETIKPVKKESIVDETETKLEDGRDNWTLTDWDTNDPEGLKNIMENDPDEFDKIYKRSK